MQYTHDDDDDDNKNNKYVHGCRCSFIVGVVMLLYPLHHNSPIRLNPGRLKRERYTIYGIRHTVHCITPPPAKPVCNANGIRLTVFLLLLLLLLLYGARLSCCCGACLMYARRTIVSTFVLLSLVMMMMMMMILMVYRSFLLHR